MKLTAKLAYSQIRINRYRTLWTLIGIILSTAMITAICTFVASGNTLVISFLGEEYGKYGGMLNSLLLIPAGIIGSIIIFMSVIVISNAFRVSANERTEQFGILKSVGATKQQIISTVMYESIFFSGVGIPIGIIGGLILAFAGIQISNHFLGEINSLTQIMIHEFSIVIPYTVAWQALIAAALISFLTVLLSAWLPARKASRIAAIEGISGTGEVKIHSKDIHTSPLVEKLFGFEGTLAAKNMKRNRRNFRATVISLTIGIVLFINISALSDQMSLINDMIYPDVDATIMVDYTSTRDSSINVDTGRKETIIAAPIDSKEADIVTERLREYEDTAIFGVGDDMETYDAIIPREIISSQMMEAYFNPGYPEEQETYDVSAEILTMDKENYAILCERAGVPIGSNILLNHYSYNDNGKMVAFPPFLFEGQNIMLIKGDASTHEIPIHGILTQEDIPNEILPFNTHIVRVLVPEGEMRGYIWYAEPADTEGFMDYANMIMGEMFPRDHELSYMELGFTTRVYKIKDYMKVMNIAIVLASVFVYSFAALLTLIGLTNVISTISTNVHMRTREFAVLQSVGMTQDGLRRMLRLESIICSAKSLMIGLPLAILLTYLINMPIRSAFPVPYRLPWLAIGLCISIIFSITWIIMQYSTARLRGKNIIETIRLER